jgi:ketosteroid isomerase-like protein
MKFQRTSLLTVCAVVATTSYAWAQQNHADDNAFADVQKHFAEAYNRKDADAMAAAFTENGIRVTPSGIFEGRDAIRRNLQDALDMGLHDYSVQRTISRSEGNFIFNAGEWQAKLGDQQFHGYYTAILVRNGDQAKIMEETVTVAAPR